MKHAMGCILAAYDEEDRRRQMACDFGCCIRSGHSGFSARDSARCIDCDVRRGGVACAFVVTSSKTADQNAR